MNQEERFFEKDLVLIGAGHTHCLFIKMWVMKKNSSVRVTLINPDPVASYTGMLPALIAGKVSKLEAQINLFKLCRSIEARLVLDNVKRIDKENNLVECSSGRKFFFDAISINVGSNSVPPIYGLAKYGVSVRPMVKFEEKWSEFLQKSTGPKKTAKITLIGGGVASTELAFSMKIAINKIGCHNSKIIIIEKETILTDLTSSQRNFLRRKLASENIEIREFSTVKKVFPSSILLEDGSRILSDFTVSCVGALPNPLSINSGIENTQGFFSVEKNLKIKNFNNGFAVGDCADFPSNLIRKSGVYAVRQAPTLHQNILHFFNNKKLKEFSPQKDHLKLLVYKNNEAIYLRNGLAFSGKIFWKIKNYIDKKFINDFSKLSQTQTGDSNDTQKKNGEMLCGGCGSKVGNTILEASLKKISKNKKSSHIVSEIGDDAAILKFGSTYQTLTTDHLRSFSPDPWLLSRITAIHSLGDIWAMGSIPKVALSTIIMPDSSESVQSRTLEEIIEGAGEIFEKENVSIVGGHTSLGSELVIGFAVGGLSNKKPIMVNGAKDGDLLVLTKPLGSGVLLAGEMRSMSEGRDLQHLFVEMSKPQGEIARILCFYSNAMTDITGFGLAGHLYNICRQSKVSARIFIDKIPLYGGVTDLMNSGVRSSIFSENMKYSKYMFLENNKKSEILFDPQTAGPFLATVPERKVNSLLKKTQDLNADCKVIGEIKKGNAFIEVL